MFKMYLSKAWQFFLSLFQINRPRGLTLDELENMDVAIDSGLTRYDLERMQLEDGHFVGSSRTVQDEELVVTHGPAPDPTKSEYTPLFTQG